MRQPEAIPTGALFARPKIYGLIFHRFSTLNGTFFCFCNALRELLAA